VSFTNFETEDSASKTAEAVLVLNVVEDWHSEETEDDDFI